MLTLIMPIGGPGAGKSTLGKNQEALISLAKFPEPGNSKIFHTCRDELYAKTRREHPDWSARKIRRHLFDLFTNFRQSVKEWRMEFPRDNIIVYLDSSNAERGGREFLLKEFNPDKLVLVNMKRSYEKLMESVRKRPGHPTFPSNEEPEKQQEIINKILSNLEFAGDTELKWTSESIEVLIVEM